MIKVFTLNKNKKIELTKQELEKLLNESYWEGYIKTYLRPYTSIQYPTFNNPYKVTCADNSMKINLGD